MVSPLASETAHRVLSDRSSPSRDSFPGFAPSCSIAMSGSASAPSTPVSRGSSSASSSSVASSPVAGSSSASPLKMQQDLVCAEAAGNKIKSSVSLLSEIEKLRKEQADLRASKKRVAKELKNAEKRKKRLKCKAKQLSKDDLLAVLLMREESNAAPSAPSSETAVADEPKVATSE